MAVTGHFDLMRERVTILIQKRQGRPFSVKELPALWAEEFHEVLDVSEYSVPSIEAALRLFPFREGQEWVLQKGKIYPKNAPPFHLNVIKRMATIFRENQQRHVSTGEVVHSVCESAKVKCFEELGYGSPSDVPFLRETMEQENILHDALNWYQATRPVAILYDMEEYVCQYFGKTRGWALGAFSALKMGRFPDHPKVRAILGQQTPSPAQVEGLTQLPRIELSQVLLAVVRLVEQQKAAGSEEILISTETLVQELASCYGYPDVIGVAIITNDPASWAQGVYRQYLEECKTVEGKSTDTLLALLKMVDEKKRQERQDAGKDPQQAGAAAGGNQAKNQKATPAFLAVAESPAKGKQVESDRGNAVFPSMPGEGYTYPHKTVNILNDRAMKRWALHTGLREDFSYEELFAHFRAKVTLICKRTRPAAALKMSETDTGWLNQKKLLKYRYTPKNFDAAVLGKQVYKEYAGGVIEHTDKKLYHMGMEFWRNDLTLHLLLHLVWLYCRNEAAPQPDKEVDPAPHQQERRTDQGASASAAAEKAEKAEKHDVIVIEDDDDDDGTWAERERASISVMCDALRSIHTNINSNFMDRIKSGCSTEFVTRVRKAIRSKMGVSRAKLSALGTFLHFVLRGHPAKVAGVEEDGGAMADKADVGQDPESGAQDAVEGDAGGSGRRAKRRRLDSQLQPAQVPESEVIGLVKDLHQGFTLSTLTALEDELLTQYQVATFADLGHGPSLLHFIAARPDLISDLGMDQPCHRPLSVVLPIVAEAVAAASGEDRERAEAPDGGILAQKEQGSDGHAAQQQGGSADAAERAVQWCVTRHFSVGRAEQLGHGPARKLVTMLTEAGVKLRANLRTVEPLLYGSGDYSDGAMDGCSSLVVSQMGANTREYAGTCLVAAPVLTDLPVWTHWEDLFASKLGPIEQFLETDGTRIGVAALQLPGGQLLKVPSNADVSTCVAAVLQDDPRQAAAAVLSLVMQAGGLRNAPLALLASAMENCFASIAVQTGHRGDGAPPDIARCAATSSACSKLCTLSLQLLAWLPKQLRPALAPQLVLQPLSKTLGGNTAMHHALLAACDSMPGMDLNCTAVPPARLQIPLQHALVMPKATRVQNADVPLLVSDGPGDEHPSNESNPLAAADFALVQHVAGHVTYETSSTMYCNRWHSVLHHLGLTCGVQLWQEHMLSCWDAVQQRIRKPADGQGNEPDGEVLIERAATGAGPEAPAEVADGTAVGANSDAALAAQADSSGTLVPQSPTAAGNVGSCPEAASAVPMAVDMHSSPVVSAPPVEETTQEQSFDAGAGGKAAGKLAGACQLPSPGDDKRAECREFVEKLRRDEFGIGLEVPDGPLKQLRERQNARMGRALQRLSHELYSSDTHFVLELVQNADDNSYPGGCVPTLEFILSPDTVHVANNEVGFSPANLRALCDVGASTKTGNSGYIGHKGIGFKSVFRVTDSPHIYSNGFQVKFDLTANESLGYILPTWMEETLESGVTSAVGLDAPATRVVLPVAARHRGQQGDGLRAQFRDLHPTLLLFLQKLQQIAVQDTTTGTVNIMTKRHVDQHVIQLCHGANAEHASRWLTVSSSLQPTVPRRGVHVSETRVALAFELDSEVPRQQAVFAFLPLRSYGLKFVVQGDFVVPSSREAVDRDSAWNQMLRAELGPLYVRALQAFLTLPAPEAQPYYWIDRWLSCLPVDGEVQGFFSPVPHSIAALVRTTRCIPSEKGELVCPCQAMVCNSEAIRELVSGSMLRDTLDVHIVHPDIKSLYSSPALRTLLGVSEFSPPQTVQLLRSVCTSGDLPRLGLEWLSGILICLFECLNPGASSSGQSVPGTSSVLSRLSHPSLRNEIWAQLQTLPLLPLSDNSFVSPKQMADAGTPLFFPLSVTTSDPTSAVAAEQVPIDQQGSTAVKADLQKWMEWCSMDRSSLLIKFVSPQLFDAVKDNADRCFLLVKALKALLVRDLQSEDVFFHHIVPSFERITHQQRPSANKLAGLLAFPLLAGLLQEHPQPSSRSTQQRILSHLSKSAYIQTNQGLVQPAATEQLLYMPANMGNPVDLIRRLPGVTWLLVHDCYMKEYPELKTAWRWLFVTAFGAEDWLHFKHTVMELKPSSEENSNAGMKYQTVRELYHEAQRNQGAYMGAVGSHAGSVAVVSEQNDLRDVDFEVEDWQCLTFSVLVSNLRRKGPGERTRHLCELARIMEQQWPEMATKLQGRWRVAGSREDGWKAMPSTFYRELLELRWLPNNEGSPVLSSTLIKPTPCLKQLLGAEANYIFEGWQATNSAMLAALNVVTQPSVSLMLTQLEAWTAKGAKWQGSLQQMTAVYEYLQAESAASDTQRTQIYDLFKSKPCIWIPKTLKPGVQQCGGFFPCSQFRFTDPANVVPTTTWVPSSQEDTRIMVLVSYYPKLRNFFCSSPTTVPCQLLVQERCSNTDYCGVLQYLVTTADSCRSARVVCTQNAFKVLVYWESQFTRGHLPQEDIQFIIKYLEKHPLLPTADDSWVKLSPRLLVMDMNDTTLPRSVRSLLVKQDIHLLRLESSALGNAALTTIAVDEGYIEELEEGHDPTTDASNQGIYRAAMNGRGIHGSRRNDHWMRERLQAFCTLQLGICPVSSKTTRKVNFREHANFHTASKLHGLIQAAVPVAQRFVHSQLTSEAYATLAASVGPVLQTLKCKSVSFLAVTVTISVGGVRNGEPDATRAGVSDGDDLNATAEQDSVTYSLSGQQLVLHGSDMLVLHCAGRLCALASAELASLFRPAIQGQELEELLYLCMLSYEAGENVTQLADKKGLRKLPSGVEAWKVPNLPPPPTPVPAPAAPPPPRPAAPPPRPSAWLPSHSSPAFSSSPAMPHAPSPPGSLSPPLHFPQRLPYPPVPPPAPPPAQYHPTPPPAKRPLTSSLEHHDADAQSKRPRTAMAQSSEVEDVEDTDIPPTDRTPQTLQDQEAAAAVTPPAPPGSQPLLPSPGSGAGWLLPSQDVTHMAAAQQFHSAPVMPRQDQHAVLPAHGSGHPWPHHAQAYRPQVGPKHQGHQNTGWTQRQTAAVAAGNIMELSLQQMVQRVSHNPRPIVSPSGSGLPLADIEGIGRYGEELVWRFLSADLVQRGPGFQLQWMNQTQEVGAPYDLVIKDANGRQVFIEVKTSSSHVKQSFEISYRQICFAQQQGDSFHIYRVLGAGSANPAVTRLIDPIKLWSQGAISMHLVV